MDKIIPNKHGKEGCNGIEEGEEFSPYLALFQKLFTPLPTLLSCVYSELFYS